MNLVVGACNDASTNMERSALSTKKNNEKSKRKHEILVRRTEGSRSTLNYTSSARKMTECRSVDYNQIRIVSAIMKITDIAWNPCCDGASTKVFISCLNPVIVTLNVSNALFQSREDRILQRQPEDTKHLVMGKKLGKLSSNNFPYRQRRMDLESGTLSWVDNLVLYILMKNSNLSREDERWIPHAFFDYEQCLRERSVRQHLK